MLILDWKVALICLGIFIVVVLFSRMVSLGSCCAVACLPLMTALFHLLVYHSEPLMVAFCTVMSLGIALILIGKHWPNLKRIRSGTESKLSFGSKKTDCLSGRDDEMATLFCNGRRAGERLWLLCSTGTGIRFPFGPLLRRSWQTSGGMENIAVFLPGVPVPPSIHLTSDLQRGGVRRYRGDGGSVLCYPGIRGQAAGDTAVGDIGGQCGQRAGKGDL